MPYRKVLIIRLSALGDVAMTIPGESAASAPFLFRTVRRGFCFARV